MFSGCTVLPDSKETELGISNQKAPLSSKNTKIVLLPCCAWKCALTIISSKVDISLVPGCHLLRWMSPQKGHKNYFKDWCLMNA